MRDALTAALAGDGAVDLTGALLEGLDLTDRTIAHLGLRSVRAPGARLSAVELTGVDLTSADLRGADLRGARLFNCSLRGARLVEADLSGAWLDGCDLRDVRLVGANLVGARMLGTVATAACFDGADLSGLLANQCIFAGASMRGAMLGGALISESVVGGIDLTDARLFYRTRCLVAEVLRQAVDGDPTRLALALEVDARNDQCWDAWSWRTSELDPQLVAWGYETFGRYPASGLTEALDQGTPNPRIISMDPAPRS